MPSIRPGKDGDQLPVGTLIFRVGKRAEMSPAALERQRPLEILFKPSSEDEKSVGKRLSVWVEELTLPDQAWDIMGRDPKRTVVVCLDVDDVHALQPPDTFQNLKAEWEQAVLKDGTPDTRPGAEGHAGIAGLLQGGEGKTDKNRRKALRSMLADCSRVSPVPVPHDISEDEIQLAAYFLFKNNPAQTERDSHWIDAVRQMRRARVRQHRSV